MRKREYKNLPKRLYWNGSVYVYRRPDGKQVALGTNKAAAIEAANRASQLLAPAVETLVGKIMGYATPTIDFICARYWDEFLKPKYAPKTLADYKHKIGVIRTRFGALHPHHLNVRIVAAFVDEFPPRQSQRYAQFLKQFFKWSVSKGYWEHNLADNLITKDVVIQRERLTVDAYKAILEVADPWLQRAMNLALQSLQRREDLVLLRFDAYRDGVLPVVQHKTSAHIRIRVGPELDLAIRDCRDDILSPFMVHKRPTRITKRSKALREHHTQVLPEQVTRAFRKAREATGLFEGYAKGRSPSFHEIRSLGATLYEKAGSDPQNLLGHKDEASTRIYLDRHEVEWIEAAGGLKV